MSEQDFLAEYTITDYEQPSVTVDIVPWTYVDSEERVKVLLIQRKHYPCKGKWALAGGFVDSKESADEAVLRETAEETGMQLTEGSIEQLYTFTTPGRDPRGWIMSIAYMAFLSAPRLVEAQDDASDAQHPKSTSSQPVIEPADGAWFDLSVEADKLVLRSADRTIELQLAFDGSSASMAFDHDKIISLSYQRIANKLYYEPVLLRVLSEPFTMKETNRLYAAFLGQTVEYENHRRKLSKYVEKVGKETRGVGRSSFVYRMKKEAGM